MASNAHTDFSYGTRFADGKAMSFQRKIPKSARRKFKRKAKISYRQILLFFIFTAGLFFLIQRTCFFLYQWKALNVQEVKLNCLRPETREAANRLLQGQVLGNIFLLDTGRIQKILASYSWVRSVRVRKILPHTLEISIEERTPAALMKKDAFYLLDDKGIVLDSSDLRSKVNLPLLVDGGNFEDGHQEKVRNGIELLQSLNPEERNLIDVIDVSEPFNLKVILKQNRTKLLLGNDRYKERLARYRRIAAVLQQKFGKLEYIDLRFEDRIYLKPASFSSRVTEKLSNRRSDHAEE